MATLAPHLDKLGKWLGSSPQQRTLISSKPQCPAPWSLTERQQCQEGCPAPSPTLCHMALLKPTPSCVSPSPTPLRRPQHLHTVLARQGDPSALPPGTARVGWDHGVGPQALCSWDMVRLRP